MGGAYRYACRDTKAPDAGWVPDPAQTTASSLTVRVSWGGAAWRQRSRDPRDAATEHGDIDRHVTRKRGEADVRLRGKPKRTRHHSVKQLSSLSLRRGLVRVLFGGELE